MKIALVSGATGGLGRALCRELARGGADKKQQKKYFILAACRNIIAGELLRQEIQEEFPQQAMEVLALDLASFASVRQCVRDLKKILAIRIDEDDNEDSNAETSPQEKKLKTRQNKNLPNYKKQKLQKISLVINNAGARIAASLMSTDGYPLMKQINFLGTALFTLALLPLLEKKAVIINIVSLMYRFASIDSKFFSKKPRRFFGASDMRAYAESKLANLLFVRALAASLKKKKSKIVIYGVDPWIVSTKMISMNAWYDPLTDIFFRPFILSPEQAAKHVLASLQVQPLPQGQLLRKKKVLVLPAKVQAYAKGEKMLKKLEKIGQKQKILNKNNKL